MSLDCISNKTDEMKKVECNKTAIVVQFVNITKRTNETWCINALNDTVSR